ncbi:ABC transporter permease [Methanospirillum hungatei]|uniref:ABC transporter permease n=1 Tax=Methanospirillum hungatei TaxID=2203 RepID=UPI0026E93272|nr:FtsX-like permease family protein [Methanospirillum hungatei]MCA1916365.1 FtsX-like permease family protein [Methanospirillum hungatei]
MTGHTLSVAFFLAIRSIQRGNRFTFLLTVAIMGLVFVNLVFLPSIISGVVVNFNSQSINYNYGNLVIEPRENTLYITGVAEVKQKISQISDVTGTSPRFSAGATYNYHGTQISGQIVGFNPRYEQEVTLLHTRLKEGEFLAEGDGDSILLGAQLAGNIDERKDKTDSLGGVTAGDSVLVTFNNGVKKTLKVKGILDTGSFGVDRNGFVTLKEINQVYGISDTATSILVKLSQNGEEERCKKVLMEYGIAEKIRTFQEKGQGFVNDAIRSFEIINAISTMVSLVIAIVVIFIVIFINTINKRRQIGILKAIGINKKIIIYSYIIQVLIIATCGILLGLALSSGLVAYLTINPLVFPGGAVYPVVEAGPVIRSVISLALVSLISGFIPSWKTANEPILDAIRGQ